ncbi:hypothetical protein F5B18DRAFT_602441 [Nemania serpens]|nr:hypothetical protein F5B18DRAFT_602441 [Nemania serpens]
MKKIRCFALITCVSLYLLPCMLAVHVTYIIYTYQPTSLPAVCIILLLYDLTINIQIVL